MEHIQKTLASMRPRHFYRGIEDGTSTGCEIVLGFNEAPAFLPGNSLFCATFRGVIISASMRPRHFYRGIGPGRLGRKHKHKHASMRPRHFYRGIGPGIGPGTGGAFSASMRPRHFYRGIERFAYALRDTNSNLLQ